MSTVPYTCPCGLPFDARYSPPVPATGLDPRQPGECEPAECPECREEVDGERVRELIEDAREYHQ